MKELHQAVAHAAKAAARQHEDTLEDVLEDLVVRYGLRNLLIENHRHAGAVLLDRVVLASEEDRRLVEVETYMEDLTVRTVVRRYGRSVYLHARGGPVSTRVVRVHYSRQGTVQTFTVQPGQKWMDPVERAIVTVLHIDDEFTYVRYDGGQYERWKGDDLQLLPLAGENYARDLGYSVAHRGAMEVARIWGLTSG